MAKRFFTEEELRGAHADPAMLAELVDASAGYVLVKMRQAGLSPSLPDLLADLRPHSVGFILDHYELDQAAKDAIAPMLARRHGSEKLSGTLSEERIDAALAAGHLLPPSAVLNRRQLASFSEAIEAQFDQGESEAADLILRSAKSIGAKAFLGLERGFVARHAWALAEMDLFGDEAMRRAFKELTLERLASQGRKPRLDDFDKWRFEKGDEAFLWSLIESELRFPKTWEDMGKIQGALDLLDPWEFHLRAGGFQISHLSDELVDGHRQELVECFAKTAAGGKDAYPGFPKLLEIKCSVGQFEEIFDARAAKACLERVGGDPRLHSVGRDDDVSLRKVEIMKLSLLEACLDDWEGVGSMMDPHGFASLAAEVHKGASAYKGTQRQRDAARRALFEGLEKSLRGATAALTIQRAGSVWLRPGMLGDMEEFAQARPTPNVLIMALAALAESKGESRRFKREDAHRLEKLCFDIGARVDLGSAKKIFKASGLALPRGRNRAVEQPAFDLLSLDCSTLGDGSGASEAAQLVLAWFDPGFLGKMAAAGTLPCERLLGALLADGSEAALGKLDDLIARFEDLSVQRPLFHQSAVAHPLGARVLGEAAIKEREQACLDEARRVAQEKIELGRELALMQAAQPPREWGFREHPANPALEELQRRSSQAGTDLEAALRGVSHAGAGAELEAALARGEYAFFDALSSRASHHDDAGMFAAVVNAMGEAELIAKLDAPDFAKLIEESVDYNGKTRMELDFGSPEANRRVAEALATVFKQKEGTHALHLFDRAACRSFSNELLIDRWPLKAVYDYWLMPEREGRGALSSSPSRGALVTPYSGAQLLRLWEKLGLDGWFGGQGANDHACDLLRDNFEGRQGALLEFIELTKERPALHAMLAASDVVGTAMGEADAGAPRMPRDQAEMRYLLGLFDWGALTEGVDQLLGAMAAREAGSAAGDPSALVPKLAREVVDKVIWRTYWDERDGAGKDVHFSELGEEKSLALASLLAAKAPAMLHRTRALGEFQFLPEHFESCAGVHWGPMGDRALDAVFMPSGAHVPEGLNLSQGSGEGYGPYALKVMRGALTWMISQRRDEDIEYLDWACKQRQFTQSELAWEDRAQWPGEDAGGPLMAPLDFFASCEELQELLTVGMERLSLKRASGDVKARRAKASRL